jgi:hypothetical protein
VQLASISTKLPSSVAYVGAQLVLPKDGNFRHALFFPSSPTWLLWTSLVSSWVCRATSGRHCKVLRAWRCKVQNASFSTPSTSTNTSQLQQLHPWVLSRGGGHLMPTSLIAYTTALHCVWFLPFHTRGGSDRSPGAGHRSGRLPQGACLPVSGMPWGSNPPYPQSVAASQAQSTHFVQSTHVRRAMRSFVTSVSGSRSSPDPVSFTSWHLLFSQMGPGGARSGSKPWAPPPTPWPTAAPGGGAGREGGALHRPC